MLFARITSTTAKSAVPLLTSVKAVTCAATGVTFAAAVKPFAADSPALPASAAVLEGPIRFLAKKLGPHTPVNNAFFDKISTIGIKKKRTDKDWLSLSEANVDAYILDPLCGIELRLGGVRDLISLANTACSTEWPYLVPVGLPILVISGANDPVGMKGRGVITVCDNLESAGHTPSVILYPTFRHEILNEDEKEKVFEDVLEWLTNVLGPAPQTDTAENESPTE